MGSQKYLRAHTISPHIKSRLRLLYASIFVKLRRPRLVGESVLIIGAGSSCDAVDIKELAEKYDNVIALNSAYFVYPNANFASIEITHNNKRFAYEITKWVKECKSEGLYLKPHALWAQPFKLLITLGVFPFRRYLAINQQHFPAYKDISEYLKLTLKDRPLYQWNGSLSVWLDLIHLSSNIKRVGLIGTDFGGAYSKNARWYKKSAAEGVHLNNLNRSDSGGPYSFLSIFRYLIMNGYLRGVQIFDYSYSIEMKELIAARDVHTEMV